MNFQYLQNLSRSKKSENPARGTKVHSGINIERELMEKILSRLNSDKYSRVAEYGVLILVSEMFGDESAEFIELKKELKF